VDAVGGGRLIYYDFGEAFLHAMPIHRCWSFTQPFSGRYAQALSMGGCWPAGMMGTIPTDVRSGLLELFYGVYEKDPDRCIGALVTMGVLIPGNDMTAVRRTATFFLSNFEVCRPIEPLRVRDS
jgi:hypothetical protein